MTSADHQRTASFQAEQTHARRLYDDFMLAWYAANLSATRIPGFVDRSLAFRFADHVLESATAILALTTNGMHGPLRRELRHLIEHAMKVAVVDQRLPNATLEERLEYLTSGLPRSSVDVGELSLWSLSPISTQELRSVVRSDFRSLSRYVHPSQRQLEERVRADARGEFVGFETTSQLAKVNSLVRRVYDIVLLLTFETLGWDLTGDTFIHILDERDSWKFHRTRFVSELSRNFDYKAERQRATT